MKILLVDDHALFRDGLRYVVRQLAEEVETMEADNFPDGLKIAGEHPELDLALLDLNLPGGEGVASIRYFNQRYPHIPIVVVSGEEDREKMERVMNCGAMGYICKNSSAQVMLGALNLVLSGGVYIPPQVLRHNPAAACCEPRPAPSDRRKLHTNEYGLTSRQMETLMHLAAGKSNKEISEAMGLAEGTIKVHIAAMYQTLGVNSRVEAVREAERRGLIGTGNG